MTASASPADKPEASPAQGQGTVPDGRNYPVLEQDFDEGSLYQLRAAVGAHAGAAGLPRHRASDVVTVVHELAVNSVQHGPGHGRLRIWKLQQRLICQVTNGGDGSDDPAGAPQDAAAVPRAVASEQPPWRAKQGHGLWLVRQLADHVVMQAGPLGASITVSFAVQPPGRAAPFQLTRRSQDGCSIIAVSGQLDIESAGQLSDAVADLLRQRPAPRLILDLSGLVFWDSFGLACLIKAQAVVGATQGARLAIAALHAQLLRRLTDAELAERFLITDSVDEAVALLTAP